MAALLGQAVGGSRRLVLSPEIAQSRSSCVAMEAIPVVRKIKFTTTLLFA